MTFLLSKHAEHGDVFAVEFDNIPTMIFGGAGGPAALFRAERDHLAVYNTPVVHELFGRAVFNLTGEPHRRVREVLRQAVIGSSLRNLTPAINALVARHIARWSDLATFDLHEATRELTLDVCARLILGLPSGGDDYQTFAMLFALFVAAADSNPDSCNSDPAYQRGLAAAGELRAMIGRRAKAVAVTPSVDVLSRVVTSSGLSLSDVGDNLLAVMIATRETTASLLTWMLIELAEAPDIAQTVADEIQVSGGFVPPTVRTILWETERRHSPNMLSRRVVVSDLVTPYGILPQGWHAAYSPAANHLFPDLFGNPQCFRPERFVGQAGLRRARGLLTFGRGLHSCVGKSFAELLAAKVATTVLGTYRLTLVDPPPAQVRYLPVKRPVCPVQAVLKRRSMP